LTAAGILDGGRVGFTRETHQTAAINRNGQPQREIQMNGPDTTADREILITRVFNAPRAIVFQERLAEWLATEHASVAP